MQYTRRVHTLLHPCTCTHACLPLLSWVHVAPGILLVTFIDLDLDTLNTNVIIQRASLVGYWVRTAHDSQVFHFDFYVWARSTARRPQAMWIFATLTRYFPTEQITSSLLLAAVEAASCYCVKKRETDPTFLVLPDTGN